MFLLFLAGAFFSSDLIWRLVILPTVDFDRTGILVFQFPQNHLEGKSHERRILPDARFKTSGMDRSALGAGVLRLEQPTDMHFRLECDDFGNVSINGIKYINQGKKQSPHNTSQAVVSLEAGKHLVLAELNNLGGESWLTLKTRTGPDEEWRYISDSLAFHPVTLSNFPTWWKAIPYVEKTCMFGLAFLVLAAAWFFRAWRPIALFYATIRRARDWLWELEASLDRQKAKRAVFAFPLFLFAVMLAVKIWDHSLFRNIAWEDSSFEYIQFACYCLATIITLGIVKKTFKQRMPLHFLAYSVLFGGLFFVSMEEISWGQRIFRLENPEFFSKNNVQREISFHNLNAVAPFLHDMYILVGLFGTIGWSLLKKLDLQAKNIIRFCVPDWFLASYFMPAFAIYTIYTYVVPHGGHHLGIDQDRFWSFFALYDQEGVELLLSLGFLMFVSRNYIRLRRMTLPYKKAKAACPQSGAGPVMQLD